MSRRQWSGLVLGLAGLSLVLGPKLPDGGAAWDRWRAAAQETLLEGQRRDDGPDHGSWDPEGPWGPDGGRVYATALALMTLAVTGTDGDASGPSGPADAVVLTSAGR